MKTNTLPNPLQIELKDGGVALSMFTDEDGAGIIFRDTGTPHEIGSILGPKDTGFIPPGSEHTPKAGEVYIKCFNMDSLNVLKACLFEVEQALQSLKTLPH